MSLFEETLNTTGCQNINVRRAVRMRKEFSLLALLFPVLLAHIETTEKH